MIYIIGNRDLDVCKIGFSERPQRRIKTIRDSVPFEIEVFSIEDGDRKKEHEYHLKYSESNIKGEWFVLSDVMNGKLDNLDFFSFIGQNITIKNEYINLSSAISALNKLRISRNEDKFNYTSFINNKGIKILINDLIKKGIKPILTKQFGKWIHYIIFIEMARSSGAKEKLAAYEQFIPKDFYVLNNTNQAVRIGVKENI